MDNYPRLFIKAGLMYALLGAALGVTIAVEPSLSFRLRFIHTHVNLPEFITILVTGVAFHVLPLFSVRKLPLPEEMKYQLISQNTGLLGMVTLHALGVWQ
jgi:hypothetical protein